MNNGHAAWFPSLKDWYRITMLELGLKERHQNFKIQLTSDFTVQDCKTGSVYGLSCLYGTL